MITAEATVLSRLCRLYSARARRTLRYDYGRCYCVATGVEGRAAYRRGTYLRCNSVPLYPGVGGELTRASGRSPPYHGEACLVALLLTPFTAIASRCRARAIEKGGKASRLSLVQARQAM